MKNISEILASVTNVSVNKYGITNESGIFTDACGLVSASVNPSSVILYNFDLMNGRTSTKKINLAFEHCDVVKMVDDFRAYWYFLVGQAVSAKWQNFANVVADELSNDEKTVYECIKKRYAHIVKILKPFTDARAAKVCPTISDMVKAVYGMKEDKFSKAVQEAFASVKNEINALNATVIEDESKLPNLKALRTALNGLTEVLWRESEVCAKWRFNANAALTADVYRVAYTGRVLDKSGNYIRTMAKGSKVLCEVVFACIEALQAKASANATAEPTNK